MNSADEVCYANTSAPTPWSLEPLITAHGLVIIASDRGFTRNALSGDIAALLAGRVTSVLLQPSRTGPVLFCTAISDPNRFTFSGPHGLVGHEITQAQWFGSNHQLVSLIKAAPEDTAAVFVDAGAAPSSWQSKPETLEILELAASAANFPIVILVDSQRQSANPMSQIPKHFRSAQHLLTVSRVEQDDGGGELLNAHLLLIANSNFWAPCAGISFTASAELGHNGVTRSLVCWGEFVKGSPERLARDARGGTYSPAIRRALSEAISLLQEPMISRQLWDALLAKNHSKSSIEKALTLGVKRGYIAKNPLRNPDGTTKCWLWHFIEPPWPFPTTGSQPIPPIIYNWGNGGVDGLGQSPNAGFGAASISRPIFTQAAPALGNSRPRDYEGPTFTDGRHLTFEMVEACDCRYADTVMNIDAGGEEERIKLKHDIAREYLQEHGAASVAESDVMLLAQSFPLPPEAPWDAIFGKT